LVNARDIVKHVVERKHVVVVLDLCEKPFVRRVKRRIDVGVVRFCRST